MGTRVSATSGYFADCACDLQVKKAHHCRKTKRNDGSPAQPVRPSGGVCKCRGTHRVKTRVYAKMGVAGKAACHLSCHNIACTFLHFDCAVSLLSQSEGVLVQPKSNFVPRAAGYTLRAPILRAMWNTLWGSCFESSETLAVKPRGALGQRLTAFWLCSRMSMNLASARSC